MIVLALRWGLDAGPAPASALLAIAVVAICLMAVGLVGARSRALAWSLVLTAAEYALWLAAGARNTDAAAPIVAALMVAAAELAYESLALEEVDAIEGAVIVAVIGRVAVAAITGAAVGGLLLLIGGAKLSTGLGFEVVGLAAAATAMWLIARLARGAAADPESPRDGSAR